MRFYGSWSQEETKTKDLAFQYRPREDLHGLGQEMAMH